MRSDDESHMNVINIEYFYYRRACVMCRAARRYIDGYGLAVRTSVDADARPVDADGAHALARRAHTVLVARGGQLKRFDMTAARPPGRRQLLESILAPSGYLRAPALLAQGYLVIGFHERALAEAFTRVRAGTDPAARLLPG